MPYDIIGDSNIIGDAVDELLKGAGDDYASGYGAEIIGAMQKGKVRQTSPTRLQRLALGLGVTSVAATSSAVVTVTPQVPFKL